MSNDVAVSTEIAAPPARVWAMIADVTRMGEWSPETERGEWVRGATGPAVGARFRGRNRHGWRRWKTEATVVDAEPGRAFGFTVRAAGLPIAEWRYDLEATAEGCRVRETWTDRRGRLARALGRPVSGVADRAAHNRRGMEITLARLKAAAEAAPAEPPGNPGRRDPPRPSAP